MWIFLFKFNCTPDYWELQNSLVPTESFELGLYILPCLPKPDPPPHTPHTSEREPYVSAPPHGSHIDLQRLERGSDFWVASLAPMFHILWPGVSAGSTRASPAPRGWGEETRPPLRGCSFTARFISDCQNSLLILRSPFHLIRPVMVILQPGPSHTTSKTLPMSAASFFLLFFWSKVAAPCPFSGRVWFDVPCVSELTDAVAALGRRLLQVLRSAGLIQLWCIYYVRASCYSQFLTFICLSSLIISPVIHLFPAGGENRSVSIVNTDEGCGETEPFEAILKEWKQVALAWACLSNGGKKLPMN